MIVRATNFGALPSDHGLQRGDGRCDQYHVCFEPVTLSALQIIDIGLTYVHQVARSAKASIIVLRRKRVEQLVSLQVGSPFSLRACSLIVLTIENAMALIQTD